MMPGESTQGKRKSLELSALPRLVVPSTGNHGAASSTSRFSHQPHALSVDFQYVRGNGEGVSPCSDISPSSRCSVVSLSPSLFPLPPCGASPGTTPGTTPPTTSYSTTPCLESPPRTSRSQKSVSSQWFSPPSPPPSTPLPPTPTQRRLASLIAATNGLENLQVPVSAKVKSPLSGSPDADPEYPLDTPMTPPRRRSTFNVDNQGFRESVVDPDAPLSPPPSSLPPPYSPGVCTPERLSNASVPNTRIDSTTPLVFHPIDLDGTPGGPHTPLTERERRKKDNDVEAGRFSGFARWHWKKESKRRKRKMVLAAVGAATAALLMALAGVAVGIYLAVSGSAAL
ncbi:hypothetical protein F4776DRAFT_77005 [Hypoxylon sp. NC0597]|nr:hypothetical protein F4776DRAFT_77005 [Hypoxylon sp. NC0597]